MIVFKVGNIFDSQCQAIVVPVNCVGVLGKGLALQFKQRTTAPTHMTYSLICHNSYRIGAHELMPRSFVPGCVAPIVESGDSHVYLLAATKDHWRNPSRIEWVSTCLMNIRETLIANNITSVAIPPLGCGYGGLRWIDVRPMIVESFKSRHDLDVEIYEPV